jgi:hypothetical protein
LIPSKVFLKESHISPSYLVYVVLIKNSFRRKIMFSIYINDIRYSVGADCFILSPGKGHDINCNVCNSRCLVQRNVPGIKVKYASGTGLDVSHDKFYCTNSNEGWHIEAVSLYLESQHTASKSISRIIKKDLDDLLAEI